MRGLLRAALLAAGLLGACALAAPGAAAPQPAQAAIALSLPVERVTLDNGLRVVLSVDRAVPTVAVAVTFDVGSRDEQPGRSGFAHLFEHMMFQGSRNVAKGDHTRLVIGRGGLLDGTTSADRTNYFETLPANELALALWLEADRMRSLEVTEQNFENQRRVVQEEYRKAVSNAPYVPSLIRLQELVYQGYWPYEHDTIGSMKDLEGAKIEWVRDFFAAHYGPNNAVLAIAGNFEPAEALALVRRYFESIPKVTVAPYTDAPFPEQTSQRTAVVRDDNARTPGVLYGWPIPPMRHADHYALELAAILLGDGASSRLHQLLVRDKGVAREVAVSIDGRRGPDLFAIDARLVEGAKAGDVERMIEGEIKALSARAPSDAEVAKARRRAQAAFVLGLQRTGARARKLGEYEIFFGDARHLNGELERYAAVQAADVQRAAREHLGPLRRTLVETYPATVPAAPAAPAAKQAKAPAKPPAAAAGKGHKAPEPKKKPAAKPKKKPAAKPKKKGP